ncbi:MAG: polysaccharide pyruvyl transferase family protein, partial [Candidatus Hodarchaeota archaeon]
NKPFLRWTQSYGPFTGMINRYLAKKDLSHQEVVFCRGDITKETVEKLLPGKKVFSFPDVATVLPYSKSDGIEHLKYKYGLAEKFVSISASSKMYAQPENNRRLTKSYQDVVVNLCDYVSNEHDLSILMVPYSISPNNSNPKRNDLALAKLVASNCKASLAVIEEDLSPSLLKSIIAASHIHVGARYHSVVAALSSGVPCVSIAWHVKYKEIMAMYGMESLTWHFRQDRVEKLYASVSQVIEHASTIRAHLERKQKNIQNLVEENTREFIKVLNKALKG